MVFFVATLFFLISTTSAADYYWSATSGDWSAASNWGGTEPTSGDTTYINNDGTALISASGELCNYLYLGNALGESGSVEMTAGSLTSSYEYVGYSGTGTFVQTAGTNSMSNRLYIGYSGSGMYVQTGGTTAVSKLLYLGYNSGATGIYTMSNNAICSAISEYIGDSGTGTFMHSSGTNTISNSLYLGYDPGSHGLYNLSGSGKLSADYGYIGLSGNASFTQTGGVHSVSTKLYLGFNATSTGTYEIGGTGTLSAKQEYIGYYGAGSATHSASLNSVTNYLYLGYYANSTGTYQLSGTGHVTAINEYIGEDGTGVLTQTGGTNTISSSLYLGSGTGKGTYALSGTGRLTAGSEYVGYSGTGTFSQTGGFNTVSYLHLGTNSGSTAKYNLEGGTLNLKSIDKNNGVVQFNFGGGTLQAGGTLSISLPMTLTGVGGNACIDSAGSPVSITGVLSGVGGLQKLGGGTLTLAATNSYSGNTVVQADTLKFTGGIGDEGTALLDIQAGKALFQTTAIVKSDLTVNTATGATFEIVGGTHQIGNLTGSGNVVVDSGSKLTLLDAVNMTGGAISVADGAGLSFGTPYSDDHLYTVSGTHIQTIDDDLGGAGGLKKQGSGRLILAGKNTYLGNTTIFAGIVEITGDCDLEGKITVADGAALIFGTPYDTSSAPESIFGSSFGSTAQGLCDPTSLSAISSSGGTAQSLSHPTVATSEIVAVPEPGTWELLASAFLGIAAVVRRKRV